MEQLTVKTTQGPQPADLVKEDGTHVWVRLPDGTVIRRSKRTQVISREDLAK